MIRLEKRGEKKAIDLTKTRADSVGQKIQITLRWRAAVDLDLHAFAITKKGCFEHIYFSNKGSAKELPFITLDKDAGVGNTAGDNEENLVVHKLDEYSKIVFAANIFRFAGFLSQGDNFGKYDGSVIVTAIRQTFEVPLTSNDVGKWALIACIDNSNDPPFVININKVVISEPTQSVIQNLDSSLNQVTNSINLVKNNNNINNGEKKIFSQKKILSGLLAILFGSLGIHKFYLGFNVAGFIMLGLTLGSCFFLFLPMLLVGFIEGIIYLLKTDDAFYQDYEINKKQWF